MEQLNGVIRAILTLAAGYMVGKGIIPAETVNDLVAAGIGIFTVVWSILEKKNQKTALDAAIAAPAGKAE
jgi:hypothetical protein